MPSRRDLLSLSVLAAWPWLARGQAAPAARRPAFEAKAMAELLKALDLPAPQPSPEVTLQAPDLHEDGSVVPLAFACRAPGVQRLLLCIDRNPFLLSAIFEPGEGVAPAFSTRVKMQETSEVRVLAVLRDGRVLSASKEVRITLGGCAGAADSVPERLGQPTLIRLQPSADGATVRALLKHEMESGQRKDEAGRVAPAWYIEDVAVRLNDRPVLTAQWGTSISKNPFLQFTLKGAKPGDRVAIAWVDNRGNRRSDEATLTAAPA
jgi:thiosulfate oxidation carrier complex protein SoxZ